MSVCACVSSKGLVILMGGNQLFKTVMETPAESSAITATFFFFNWHTVACAASEGLE